MEEFTARSCIISGAQNCHVKKFGNLTERFLIPHGLCTVYIGMPFHNMWFTVEDDGEVGEYVLFIADASASNAFTVSFKLIFVYKYSHSPENNVFYYLPILGTLQ